MRFGVPFTETDTVFFGVGIEQTKIEPGTGMPSALPTSTSAIWRFHALGAADAWVGAATRATAHWCRPWAACSASTASWASLAIPATCQGQLPVPAVHSAEQEVHAGLQRRGRLGQGPERASRSRCSRTSTAAAWVRCAASSRARWAESCVLDATGESTGTFANIGGAKKMVLNTEVVAPFPGAGNDRTLRMFGFFDIGNVYGEDEQRSTTAQLRASTGVGHQLDFADRPA